MKFYTDGKRHLVCIPYSLENLHKMAYSFGIGEQWFHPTAGLWHYDIPKKRRKEIENKCILVSPKDIVRICKGTYNE